MTAKSCSRCHHPAELSLRFHLATVGRTPRQIASLKGIALCSACLEQLVRELRTHAPAQLIEPLRAAQAELSSIPRSIHGKEMHEEA